MNHLINTLTKQAAPLLSEPGPTCIYVAFAILMLAPLVTSCGRPEQQLDAAWSPQKIFSSSQEALNSTFGIVNWNGEPVCVNGNNYYFLEASGTNWTKKSFSQPVDIKYPLFLADPASTRFILSHGRVEDGKLEVRFVFCSLDLIRGIQKISDRSVTFDSKEFGEMKRADTEEPFEKPLRQQYGPPRIVPDRGGIGQGTILGDDVFIPYAVYSALQYGTNKQNRVNGGNLLPGKTGFLHSAGNYSRWTNAILFDFDSYSDGIFVTHEQLYVLCNKCGGDVRDRGLWCARISRTSDLQRESKLIAPTYRKDIFGAYSAGTDSGTIHLVWLDDRHVSGGQLWALRTGTPDQVNLELYYRSRKDSATEWTKEILLSKGLRYVFAPQIAVEGNNIVVVWSGYQKGYGEFCPSDIFFTTSRDGGKTWAPTARATDNAKSGLVSGRPSVALHNGVIHLFYIQGKLEEHNLGGGLHQLRQESWPIYYMHRPFPN